MTGFTLHDAETQEELGTVIITKEAKEVEDGAETISEAWESFNKLEETEEDTSDVDAFVDWFNENYVTQIERLYLEFVQH